MTQTSSGKTQGSLNIINVKNTLKACSIRVKQGGWSKLTAAHSGQEGAASVECLKKQLKLPLSESILFYFSTIFYRKIILFYFSTMLFRKHSCGKASFCSPHHIPDTLASSSSSASPGYRQASGWPRHEAFPMPPR